MAGAAGGVVGHPWPCGEGSRSADWPVAVELRMMDAFPAVEWRYR